MILYFNACFVLSSYYFSLNILSNQPPDPTVAATSCIEPGCYNCTSDTCLIESTTAIHAWDCQVKCQQSLYCWFFSFSEDTGVCNLNYLSALDHRVEDSGEGNTFRGPWHCWGECVWAEILYGPVFEYSTFLF